MPATPAVVRPMNSLRLLRSLIGLFARGSGLAQRDQDACRGRLSVDPSRQSANIAITMRTEPVSTCQSDLPQQGLETRLTT